MALKHTIFLLHGMGDHGDGWESDFIAAIRTAYNKYPKLKKKPFAERFEFVPLSYDAKFRELLDAWIDNAKIVADLAKDLGLNIPGEIDDWLSDIGDLKGNALLTHAMDVLLYRGIRLVRESVCHHVAAKMLAVIKKQHDDHGRSNWSVIAHSLGTAVIHDTLARITAPNANWPGNLAFSHGNEQANVVMMVANVSKVLEVTTTDEPYDAYRNDDGGSTRYTVAPGNSGQSGRICNYYLNARHVLDPFTIPKRFDPLNWPDKAAHNEDPPLYQELEVKHLHEVNIHDFAHYMKNPRVHVPLFRCLVSPGQISNKEFEDAKDSFPDVAKLTEAQAIALNQKLSGIPASLADKWLKIGKLWTAYKAATGENP